MLAEWYNAFPDTGASTFDDAFWADIIAAKIAVNGVLEKARTDKIIGASLSAEVEIYAQPELKAQLEKLGDELRFVLITSAAMLAPISASNEAATTDVDGLEVRVRASEGMKCTRCWHHRDDVGQSLEHPELCFRCIDNVDGDGEVRHYA